MKTRLDVLLVEKGLAPSREKAKALIMSGIVYVNDQKEDKAGSCFDSEQSHVEVRGKTLPYVSRGGLKLEKALKVFPISLKGLVTMDIGSSTGGFTDCMLQNGAVKVYAIDVGTGQLAWKLRSDERVVCMEKTNFRYLTPADLPEQPEFASCDVSFISLSKILPAAFSLLKEGSLMVCLIKPQFEAGKDKVGKKGVVRDPAVHEEVVINAIGYAEENGFTVMDLAYSPIRGPEGNIEYLMLLRKPVAGEHGEESQTTETDMNDKESQTTETGMNGEESKTTVSGMDANKRAVYVKNTVAGAHGELETV